MAFEKYVKNGRMKRPFASIWLRGQIGIGKGASEDYKLKNYTFAVLFYDTNMHRIGIKVTNDENEDGAKMMTHGKTGVVISARSFLCFYHIDHRVTRTYALDYNDNENLYVIDLQKPRQKGKDSSLCRNRSKRLPAYAATRKTAQPCAACVSRVSSRHAALTASPTVDSISRKRTRLRKKEV